MSPLIEAAHLGRRFGTPPTQRVALSDVGLCVELGELVAVEGPSGAGKSTLLHLLAGLDRPDTGDVIIDGVSLGALTDRELARLRREHIGLILQTIDLLPTLAAWENVAVPGLLDGHRLANLRGRAHQLLDQFGLGDRGDQRPDQLSGGEQQRVAVARALFNHPTLLIADEPTGALDTVAGDEVLRVLRTLADQGQTVILATHSSRAAAYAHRTLRLVDGVLEDNTSASESDEAFSP